MAQQKRISSDVQRGRSRIRSTDPGRLFQAVSSETQRRSVDGSQLTIGQRNGHASVRQYVLQDRFPVYRRVQPQRSNQFQGNVRSQLIVGLVSSEVFSGNYKKSPFNFQPFDCNVLALYVDVQSYPAKPLQPNFTEKKLHGSL
jgi:hypothetical protein